MCRHAAYIGDTISLADFMLSPSHNLIDQAIHPREMRIGRINADGFGIGWYLDNEVPATYRNIQPIWSDTNLPALGASLQRTQWIAMVRGASPGLGISIDNTHPFCDDRWLFTLNGIICDFAATLRPVIANRLSAPIAADILGHTDAEFLFALLRQFSVENPEKSTTDLLQIYIEYIHSIAGECETALSILLCEKGAMYAVRHAINLPNPTLYYSEQYQGGTAVSSEPMGNRDRWHLMPEQHLLIAEHKKSITLTQLG